MDRLVRGRLQRRFAVVMGVAISGSVAGSVAAQVTFLENIPGLTDLQLNVAQAVDTLCPKLPAPDPSGNLTQRLSNSCTLMVVSAANNQGTNIAPNFNLKVSNGQLATALQAISPVQMNAQKQIGVEAGKMSIIGTRLLELRGGARGFIVGVNGEPQDYRRLGGATGGAAGDDAMAGRWGGFLNINYAWGKVDQTSVQDAYDYGSFTVLGGADYRVNDNFVLGGALSYTDTKSDYNQSLGQVKARTFSIAGYGTYYVDTWYVDGFVAYGNVDYDSSRRIFLASNNPAALPIDTTASASPNGDQWSLMLAVGRAFDYGTWTITPSARLGYIEVKNKSFDETEDNNGLGLHVDERKITSLQSALGAKFSTVISTAQGVFGPYFYAAWVHEFENDNPSILARYVNDPSGQQFFIPTASPTRDYAALTVGSSAQFANNVSGFLQFGAAVGLKDQTNYAVLLGVRKQF
jgi:outer membrane lipase/esterase